MTREEIAGTMKRRLMGPPWPMVRLLVFALVFSLTSGVAEGLPESILKEKGAVVAILISHKDGRRLASATGFIIDPAGIVVTNYHVISEWIERSDYALSVRLQNGTHYAVKKLLAADKEEDLAIIKVDGKMLPALRLAQAYKLKRGETIVVIGRPSGVETVTDGIISSVRWEEAFIQINATASPGSSGSPLLNSQGEVIGVVCCTLKRGKRANFAIPVKRVSDLLGTIKKQKGK